MIINTNHEEYKLDYVAKQATSALWYTYQGCVILASVMVDKSPAEGDFLPLSVQFSQRAYAIGRIPGGFNKREGKLSEFETLTSRLIDRTLRPLFPKHYAYPTQITLLVLSHDQQSDLQVCALHAAANALYLANIGMEENVSAVRIAKIADEIILNPNVSELQKSSLDLYISGTKDALLMVEMCAQESLAEADLLEILARAHKHIRQTCMQYAKDLTPYRKPFNLVLNMPVPQDTQLETLIEESFHVQVLEVMAQMAKSERQADFFNLAQYILNTLQEDGHFYALEHIQRVLEHYTRRMIRQQILHTKIRPDGRGYTDIRPIEIETNLLPHCHGSILFTRGHTQALVVCTLGGANDARLHESLDSKTPLKERFMFDYNFLPFSVGESAPLGAPSRRELGHGHLAKRALQGSLPNKEQTIRLVSEILESNGSSSMASVCGGSLALCASGIEVRALIAGVAMGLIVEGEEHAILSDISALEDMQGDMDFKIAGSAQGVVAMQMDTKTQGISLELFEKILKQAKGARECILEPMQRAKNTIVPNVRALPAVESFFVPAKKIATIIGAGGRTIKEIIERFGVLIDLDKHSGAVHITSNQAEDAIKAKNYILELIQVQPYCLDEVLEVEVKKIADFGVFVRLPRGGDALLHKSCLEKHGLSADALQESARLQCKISAIHDSSGKIDVILA
ncbi:polyribonucleotide nucleotidyltransferase [Helicobacter baculiformis]|uniref:Polyribonucleotide nucleotidyltransferase n=1 Tax=Helicobacter baculiformis TaxID=427351 RepID=A0ABV7ZKA4_9HELI|nr:polyribonucleotide nucleotidyltransferase [Helicobacter baculiformis]